ncbi:hydrogenase expression/formation protein HypE [Chloroflexota bacterium]
MEDRILLAHGSGGKLSHDLVENNLVPLLKNPLLDKLDDAAVLELKGRLAFTTDSYVVSPIFFPGGDIGKLAICGTVNDLAMSGAKPIYLSLSLIIEEGLPLTDLNRIMASIQRAAEEAEVKVVTGDTKVVNKGSADKLFINTAGIGLVLNGVDISGSKAIPGDKVILSGGIGEHGIAVMSQREGLQFSTSIESDCAPLNKLVAEMLEASPDIHCLRDPTRGGLASTLNEFTKQSGVGIRVYEGKIPVQDAVGAACDLLGLDPLYVANEGKLVAVVPVAEAEKVLETMRRNQYGTQSAIIGEVVAEHPGKVFMITSLGASRIIDMLTGELLPRIC